MVRFIILFEGRSGSSFTVDTLNSHPSIIARGELLKEKYGKGQRLAIKLISNRMPWEKSCSAVGFKTKVRVLKDPNWLRSHIESSSMKIIHLTRRNIVKQSISGFNAIRIRDKTKNWNLTDEKDRLGPLDITPDRLEKQIEFREGMEAELKQYVDSINAEKLFLLYEELIADETKFFEKIQDYLGVSHQPLQKKVLKNTKDDLREAVSNFDELVEHFKGTPYEEMFYENS